MKWLIENYEKANKAPIMRTRVYLYNRPKSYIIFGGKRVVDANTFTLIFNDDDIRKSDQKIRENMIPMWKNKGRP